MKYTLAQLLIVLFALTTHAQDFFHENYDWEEKPEYKAIDEEHKKENYIEKLDKRVFEYANDEEVGGLVVYETHHQIKRVYDESGIDASNRVYVPLDNVIEIVELKARTISPDGEVKEVTKENIKEVEELEDYGNFKIFALEGLEEGSDAEYTYTLKKGANIINRVIFQSSVPLLKASIEVISPEHLKFKAKSYNGFKEPTDTLLGGKRHIKATHFNIPPLEEEKYSAYKANLMRVDFKWSENTSSGSGEMFGWKEAASESYERYCTTDKKTNKKLKKRLKKADILKLKSDEEKIIAIENYLKNPSNFKFDEKLGEDYQDLEHVLDNEAANQKGMIKLFAHALMVADIEFEITITSDRYNAKFDPDFESWLFLSEFLIHFPSTGEYIAPTQQLMRYPMIPHEWFGQKGLHIKPTGLGDIKTGLPVIREIPPNDLDDTYDNMEVTVSFDDPSTPKVKMYREFSGMSGSFKSYFNFMSEEQASDFLENNFIKMMAEDTKAENIEVTGKDINKSAVAEPLTISFDAEVRSLTEKAGNSYLFNIGKTIGQQVEMYQEKERQTDVEIEYPHQYERIIHFTVPEGYTVKNLDKLNMDIGDGETMSFTSSYEKDGRDYTVTVNEFYTQLNYPKSQFKAFRDVINAAADFNKIVLIFEKSE